MERISNNKVDKAGGVLISYAKGTAEYECALADINTWRSLHREPLNLFQTSIRKKAKSVDGSFIFAQRLKKMKSIEKKLIRFKENRLKLSSIQDVGGCRVILSSIANVYELKAQLIKSRWRHEFIKESDYIETPKLDGYRGIHLVFRTKSAKKEIDGLKIEVQLRTTLQHSWATAVEMMDLINGTALKTGEIKEYWNRFFVLMSYSISLIENSPLMNDIDENEIIKELIALNRQYNILDTLEALNFFTNNPENSSKEVAYYLLHIDGGKRLIAYKEYTKKEYERANRDYTLIEKNENEVDNVV